MYLMRMHEWSQMKEKSRRNLERYLSENPAIKAVYDLKRELMKLILIRVYGKSQAREQIPKFLDAIQALESSGLKSLETLRNT
jgi:hypothetical protein